MATIDFEEVKFLPAQQQAFEAIIAGKNVFLTGPSGTGKSMVIHMFKNFCGRQKNIGITSTTGISSLLIGGTTIHSYLGIGLGNGSVEDIVHKITKNQRAKQRWMSLDILCIDEISMLSPELFDKLEEVARIIRRKMFDMSKPEPVFGGIQLILTGDFLQLPVVGSDNFCFEANSWDACVDVTVHLTEIVRQEDVEFCNVLNDLRFGKVTNRAKKLINSRIGIELTNDLGIRPTRIHTTNLAVDEINEKELDKLAAEGLEFYEFSMEVYFHEFVKNREQSLEKYRRSCLAPDLLQLCKGAQVMLLYNMDLECGLANGSRGVVIDFLEDKPIVKFLNGEERVIDFHTWDIEEGRKKIVSITQIPLKLAYAITAHKCVSENTLICTDNGMCRISDISYSDQASNETRETYVQIMGKTGYELCTQIYKGKYEPTLVINTSLGYRIEGSYRHPILTKDGWKILPDIRIDDSIALKNNTCCFGQNITTSSFVLANPGSEKVIPEYVDEKLCNFLGMLIKADESYDHIVETKFEKDFFQWCGLVNSKIPWVVLQNTRKAQIEFLKGLLSVENLVKNTISITTSYIRFAHDIHVMLLNLGIISCMKRMSNGYEINTEIFPDTLDSSIFYDKVVSIEHSQNQLYDVYVPGTHTFIGDGIVNHNSQGSTLDFAEIDLSNVFTYGQAYVALSRVRNKEGLKILNVNFDTIRAHPKAIKFYKGLNKV